MAILYVTSTEEGAGKTAFCATFGKLLSSKGRRVGYFKPLLVSKDPISAYADPDIEFCKRVLNLSEPAGVLDPTVVSPDQLTDGLGPVAAKVRDNLKQVSAGKDLILVEGLSSADPAGAAGKASAELAGLLNSKVVLVTGCRWITKPDAVVALAKSYGDRVLGALVNGVPPVGEPAASINFVTTLERAGVPVVGVVPEDRLLRSFSVGDLAKNLGGEIVFDPNGLSALVEHFMVGANALDPGDLYYGRMVNKAVIVRGDRPDMQWSALETPTKCLLLTNNIKPIPYVLDRAKEQGVPVIVVPKGTIETVAELEKLVVRPAFHHKEKLMRFHELLTKHLRQERLAA